MPSVQHPRRYPFDREEEADRQLIANGPYFPADNRAAAPDRGRPAVRTQLMGHTPSDPRPPLNAVPSHKVVHSSHLSLNFLPKGLNSTDIYRTGEERRLNPQLGAGFSD